MIIKIIDFIESARNNFSKKKKKGKVHLIESNKM